MRRLLQVAEFDEQLLGVPDLIDAIAEKSHDAVEQVLSWLARIEETLQRNRLPQAGLVAGLRAELLATLEGLRPQWLEMRGHPSSSRVRRVVAGSVLRRAAELVQASLERDRARFAEAEEVCRRLVAFGRHQGRIPDTPEGAAREAYVRRVWASLSAEGELGALSAHLVGLLGAQDALIQLDRTLTAEAEVTRRTR